MSSEAGRAFFCYARGREGQVNYVPHRCAARSRVVTVGPTVVVVKKLTVCVHGRRRSPTRESTVIACGDRRRMLCDASLWLMHLKRKRARSRALDRARTHPDTHTGAGPARSAQRWISLTQIHRAGPTRTPASKPHALPLRSNTQT